MQWMCVYAVQIRDEEALCPFCRIPSAMSREENINRLQKRVKVDDAHAINHLGDFYYDGSYGFPQDYAKALELWHRAAELGCAKSIANIGRIYYLGRSVEVDTKKALQYWEDAAIRGNTNARHMLSYVEQKAGNMDRAIKHHMIAVRGGDNSSLAIIQELYSGGQATRDEYTKALRSYQKYLDEVKSSQRDEAATANEKYKYIE